MTQDTQNGFTLIELLIAMFIVSILASIAIPTYSFYTTRTKIAEGLVLSSAVQRQVEEFHHVNGVFPGDNGQAGLSPPAAFNGSFVGSITVIANGVIQVEFDDPALAGGLLEFTPSEVGPAIRWSCGSPNITTALLPKECR